MLALLGVFNMMEMEQPKKVWKLKGSGVLIVSLYLYQEDVFQCVGVPLVRNALAGYNTSVVSYGQVFKDFNRHKFCI